MKPEASLALRLRFKNLARTALLFLLLALLAWSSGRWHWQSDWTADNVNSLSATSRETLAALPDPVRIDIYLDDLEKLLKKQIVQLLRRYQHYKPDLQMRFVNPKTHPQALRELGVDANSAVFVYYRQRAEQLSLVNETTVTNALLQLAYDEESWISVLSGHGERSPAGQANHDFGVFGEHLRKRKQKLFALNLGEVSAIPDNTALLVIAGPRTELLPGEVELLRKYIRQGGNLLWLTDPDALPLPALSQALGITILPGTIVDHQAQLYAINDPSFVLLTHYPSHPASKGLQTMTLFPQAAALQSTVPSDYKVAPILTSGEQSWTETGPIAGTIAFDPGQNETKGPVNLGLALTRPLANGGEQRIAAIGDGDFISNAYLGNVGNLEFGFKLINWLTHQDKFLAIPVKRAADAQLQLDRRFSALIAYGFLIVLPLLLFGSGWFIWRQRQRR